MRLVQFRKFSDTPGPLTTLLIEALTIWNKSISGQCEFFFLNLKNISQSLYLNKIKDLFLFLYLFFFLGHGHNTDIQ